MTPQYLKSSPSMLQEMAIHEVANWSSENKFQLNPVNAMNLSLTSVSSQTRKNLLA